jgi:hypothetical protein
MGTCADGEQTCHGQEGSIWPPLGPRGTSQIIHSGVEDDVNRSREKRITFVKQRSSPRRQVTSLDALARENRTLRELFAQINASRGSSVEARYDYGNAAKQVIRHLATRQASLMDVSHAISEIPNLRMIAIRMMARGKDRRSLLDALGDMSRGIQGVYLNQGQDFDGPLTSLIHAVVTEIDWELTEAIPLIERTLDAEGRTPPFRSARYVQSHAPTRLSESGPRWWEHAPIVSRIVTLFDHLRDHPAAERAKRITAVGKH